MWTTQGFLCVAKWFIDKCLLLHFTAVNLMLCNYHLIMRHSYFGRVKTSLILLSLILHRSQLKAHVFHILIKTLRRKTMISRSQRVKKNFVTCNAKCFEFCWTSRPKNTPRTLTKWKKHWNWELKIILKWNHFFHLIERKPSPFFWSTVDFWFLKLKLPFGLMQVRESWMGPV